MKKSIILIGILIMALCAPVMAQSFTDVATDHWAYSAVQDLANKGYIVGYPDGTFSGKRALTRYEFAMAISRVIAQLPVAPSTGGFATKADVADLQNKIDNIKPGAPASADAASKADLEKVKRLVDEFRDELATLGVDVDAAKREIADLRTRVEAVENVVKNLPEVSVISNFYVRGETTHPESRTFGLEDGGSLTVTERPRDVDGRNLDEDNNILQGVRSLYDIDLIIKGKLGDKANAVAVFNAGNYLNWLRNTSGDISISPRGEYDPTDAPEQVTPYYLYANMPMNWGPLGKANVTVGKFPFQLTPYTFRMLDTDSYFTNWKTDSGDYPVFGAQADFMAGPVGIKAFAFKNDGANLPIVAGASGYAVLGANTTQTAGARATIKTPGNGVLGLNYLVSALDTFDGDTIDDLTNTVYGADWSGTAYKNIGFSAAWTRSEPKIDGDKIEGWDDNDAWEGRLSAPIWKMNLSAGYRQIEPNFDAPGAWSKGLGFFDNLVDVKGPFFSLSLPVNNRLSVYGGGEIYTGLKADPRKNTFNYGTDDDLQRFTAGVKYAYASASSVNLVWEHLIRKITATAENDPYDSTGDYVTFGVDHQFTTSSSMRLAYQFIGTDDNILDLDPTAGVATAQFTVKF